jgi:hypothetical protein
MSYAGYASLVALGIVLLLIVGALTWLVFDTVDRAAKGDV